MDLYITDEVEEQLELCGESTAFLRCRAEREERMATPGKDAVLLSGPRRLALARFLMAAITQVWARATRAACPQKAWFDSMHMCDVLAARGLDFDSQAASHAIAVLRILAKADDASQTLPSEWLATLTELLWRHGAAVEPAPPEDIDAAERRILRCMGWQIWSPSLHSWLAALLSRLRVLGRQHLAGRGAGLGAVLVPLWQQSYRCGTAVVMHEASVGLLAPRSLAMGLLGLGCVREGVLPLDDLRPEWLGAAEWEQAYVRAMGPVPAAKPDSDAEKLTQVIQLAFDSDMGAVRNASGRVALVLSGVPPPGAREHVSV